MMPKAASSSPSPTERGETPDGSVPAFCRGPTLVLGCGNLLFGDDGFGCAVVETLERRGGVPAHVVLMDAGTAARKLLFTICLSPIRPRRLLVVDAVDLGRPPGAIFELLPEAVPEVKLDDFSMHQLPTSNLLRELERACDIEVRVLACQTAEIPPEVRVGLSEEVRSAVSEAADWVVEHYYGRERALPLRAAR